MSRMFDRLRHSELAIGTSLITQGPEWIEILGYAGLDFVCIDFMISATDWHQAAEMIRAARLYGVTPWVRLQGYPWRGSSVPDARLPADVLRALAIGAEGVTASVNTAEQVEAILRPASDWHRRAYIWQHDPDRSPLAAHIDEGEEPPIVFPMLESLESVANLESIFRVPGIKAIFLAMGDLTREMGHPFDDRHPDVRSFVARTAALAKQNGVMVFANTMAYLKGTDTPQAAAEAVNWYANAGISVVWLPSPWTVVQRYYEKVLGSVDDQKPSRHPLTVEVAARGRRS